ncbi:MAG: M42 family metallopeptidase [Candidatus Hodarchaeota archaeon]
MTFENDFKIIKNLTEIQSCSGNESRIREYIKETIASYCDKIETDVLGNLFCFINGKAKAEEDKLKIMLDAHMDEIGLMVRFIDKNGFIRFSQIGGQNPRILPGQEITIHSSSGEEIIGVIGEKPIHLLKEEEKKKPSKLEDLFIDAGFSSAEEAKKYISVGDYIIFKQEATPFIGNKRIFSKSFDDRAGCFVLIKLIIELSQIKETLDKDLIFLFASQEEIGVRGATVGAYKITPDIGLTVEVTHAIDFPGISKDKYYECKLGSGASISTGPNLYPKLTKILIETAKEENIPYVLEAEPRPTPTNARAIQMTKSGIPCTLVAIPLRYMHTNVATIEYQDIIHTKNLIKAFLLRNLKSAIKL